MNNENHKKGVSTKCIVIELKSSNFEMEGYRNCLFSEDPEFLNGQPNRHLPIAQFRSYARLYFPMKQIGPSPAISARIAQLFLHGSERKYFTLIRSL